MLRPRLIPTLLIHNGGLVKTIKFAAPRYVGDPINTVRIFNEKEVDELIILDIDATVGGVEPNYEMISHLAAECRMPLCYGGGVKTVEQLEKIVSLGVEKVSISSAAVLNPNIISDASMRVGRQSVVVVVDVKKTGVHENYEVVTHNGTFPTGLNPVDFIKQIVEYGAGEIVLNSIDNDGVMLGYDLKLIETIWESINVPLTVVGGAGSIRDIAHLINRFGTIGAGAGSIFIFKGKYRAVLINYPDEQEKSRLYE